MIIKQIVKSVPVVIKGELLGGEVKISFVFLGRNLVSFRLKEDLFVVARNFIEDIYQEMIGKRKDPDKAAYDRIKETRNDLPHKDFVFTGHIRKPGLSTTQDKFIVAPRSGTTNRIRIK